MTATHKRLPSGPASALYKRALYPDEQRRVAALKAVLKTTALATGVGAGIRGLQGLRDYLFPTTVSGENPYAPRQIKVPVVTQASQDERDKKRLGLGQDASLQSEALAAQRAPQLRLSHMDPQAYLPKTASERPLERIAEALTKDAGMDEVLAKVPAPNPDMIPGIGGGPNPALSAPYLPLLFGGAMGGAMGGWKLVDWVMENRRKAKQQADLAAAKQDYRNALNEQYASMFTPQKAAAAKDLDKLATAWEKQALDIPWFGGKTIRFSPQNHPGIGALGTGVNAGVGGYLTLLGLTGLGTHMAVNRWTKDRSEAAALDRALKMRRMDAARRPAPVMAVADPVSAEEFDKA